MANETVCTFIDVNTRVLILIALANLKRIEIIVIDPKCSKVDKVKG